MTAAEPDRTKRCSTCRTMKPLAEFNKLRRSNDGHQFNCRDCSKQYHYDNWDRHMAQIRARKKRRHDKNRRFIVEYLLEHPCVDCGETDILVLEFDHVAEKNENVATRIRNDELFRLKEEIELCEVVCANCHRRRTAARAGKHYRRDLLAEKEAIEGDC